MKLTSAAGLGLALMLTACGSLGPVLEATPSQPALTDSLGIVQTASPASSRPALTSTVEDNAPTPGGVDDCLGEGGEIEIVEIPAEDEVLIARIYTPPCYLADPERRYPALYILHGDTQDDRQWDELGLDEWADRLIDAGEIPPLIIIMPQEITWINPPDNPFGDQVVQTIIPWVDAQYRTLADREFRAVGGLSRGGNWAVRLGLLHWGLFGSIGVHSTPLFFGDLNRIPAWVEVIPESMLPRIWIDIAEADKNLAESEQFHQLLIKLNVPHQRQVSPGLHDDSYWKSQIETYLRWYSAGWTE